MKLVSYNIQYSLGKDGQYDLERIADTVAGADIIALQEVERNWQRTGMTDQPAALGRLLPEYFWVYGPAYDMDASERQADGRVDNRRKQFGPMVLSKQPILSSRLHLLPKMAPLHHFNTQTGALEAVIQGESGPLRLYAIHLAHFLAAERLEQIDALWRIIRAAPQEGGCWTGQDPKQHEHWECGEGEPPMPAEAILLGDFNLVPQSAEYQALVGPMNEWAGRVEVRHRLIDTWVAAGHAEDAGVTFPSNPRYSTLSDLRIDYCFVTAGHADKVRRAWIDNEAQGSDHQPVWVELEI